MVSKPLPIPLLLVCNLLIIKHTLVSATNVYTQKIKTLHFAKLLNKKYGTHTESRILHLHKIFYSADKLNALYETYIDIANWGRILHQNVNKELSHMFVERLQLPPKERYEQFNRRYPRLINRVKLKYVAAFLGISIYTLSRVRAKK